jgi:hypothetical protein
MGRMRMAMLMAVLAYRVAHVMLMKKLDSSQWKDHSVENVAEGMGGKKWIVHV